MLGTLLFAELEAAGVNTSSPPVSESFDSGEMFVEILGAGSVDDDVLDPVD